MKSILGILLMGLCASQAGAENARAPRPDTIGEIKVPTQVPNSKLIGLTEKEVMAALKVKKLNREGKDESKRWFSGGRSSMPPLGGYRYGRHHILTFVNGKVVKHEIVDRPIDCVMVKSPDE